MPSGSTATSANIGLDSSFKSQIDAINHYRKMAEHFDVDNAINDIVNEFVYVDEINKPVTVILDDTEFSDSIKEKIREEFGYITKLLQFNTKAYDVIRKWFVDGLINYHIIVDMKNTKKGILKLNSLDPRKIKLVRKFHKEKGDDGVERIVNIEEFYIYSDEFYINKHKRHLSTIQNQSLMLNKDSIAYVNSGIIDTENNLVRSHLHKAIKPLNQLNTVEDALVIYRVSRAPERRIFYIDVGSMQKSKAEVYLDKIARKHKSGMIYDAKSGNVLDNSKSMSILDDFFLPRREGGRGTEVSNLPGGQNLGEIEDILYFQKRLYKSLTVPVSRMESESMISLGGRSAEITRDELKFNKFISRLRVRFNELFNFLLMTQLVLKKVITKEEWMENESNIRYDYQKDTYLVEQKESDIIRDRLDVAQSAEMMIGKFFSKLWVQKNILRMTEEEIEDEDKQMEKETKDNEDDGIGSGGGAYDNAMGGDVPGGEEEAPLEEPEDGEEEEEIEVEPEQEDKENLDSEKSEKDKKDKKDK